MTDTDELNDLAEMLERKAKWSDARSALAEHDATIQKTKEVVNAAYCRRKAEVCRRAAAKMAGPKPPRNVTLANAPTQEEWDAYAAELKWPAADARACFDHFVSCGWRIGAGTGKAMRDWKSTARNGYRRWREKHPEKGAKKLDPEGWRDFLKSVGAPYEPHEFAAGFLKRDFQAKGAK